jgi:hydrogenase maturation protease
VTTGAQSRSVLLIGYGNDLRGDDCAGRRTAEIIADLGATNIKVRSVHQLTPDLAPLLAEADLAIFADASAESFDGDIRVRKLQPQTPSMGDAHAGSPVELLGLAIWLYDRCPEAYAVDIAASNFGYCETASSRTEQGIASAVSAIVRLAEAA